METHHTVPAYVLRLPLGKTQKLSFELVFKGIDKPTQELFSRISNVREEMKAVIDSESSQGSIGAIEKYMPALFGLMNAAESLPPEFSKYLRIIWTTPICIRNQTNSFVYSSFRWDVVMTLLEYGILFRNQAHEMLQSANVQSADFDEKSKTMANLLCKAAGIFEHISQNELSQWKVKPDVALPEVMDETFLALSAICIAEAQEITVKKGLAKGTSGAVLAKLCVDIHQKYEHALSLLRGMSAAEQVSKELMTFVSVSTVLWKAVALRLMAEDSCNKGSYGLAVAYTKAAAELLIDRKDKEFQHLETLFAFYNEEKNLVRKLLNQYSSDNDTVYYELVPPHVDMPEAKCLMKVIPFQPPQALYVPIGQQKGSDCVIS
eukprot:TRINITY_DN7068_c0_g1_i1.p1 TRINITY_DN7068_c0_g1~~TRINITY_DN7068_c0_g1_i1.p1  ORF type:complete len:377 (+),score=67.66 TRINITY_DN7068_c0_g1_i1:89-1219(+)